LTTDQDLQQRRKKVQAALDKVHLQQAEQKAEQALEDQRYEKSRSIGLAFRVTADLVAGVLVGALIGWALDNFVGIAPWGLVIFLPLGFIAGVVTVLRTLGVLQKGQWQVKEAGNNSSGDRPEPSKPDDEKS
jgi:ATP synthase protein I